METADNQQQSFLSEEQEIQEAIQRIKEGYQLVDQLKVLELYELKDKISKKIIIESEYTKDNFILSENDLERALKFNCIVDAKYYLDYGWDVWYRIYVLTKKYKYVAIASAILKSKKFGNVIPVVQMLYDNGIKVHLLGCASYNHLIAAKYAWSCDASSYGRWASFSKLIYFSKSKNKEITLSIREKDKSGRVNEDYI